MSALMEAPEVQRDASDPAPLFIDGLVITDGFVAPKRLFNEPDPTLTPRVKIEAKRLDRLFPGWADRIDIHRLNIHNAQNCVLGQSAYRTKGFFRKRQEKISFNTAVRQVRDDMSRQGEYLQDDTVYYTNRAREAWIDEILARR